jgi:hypothetical protein
LLPVNVHLPVVFAVYAQLRSYCLKIKAQRELYQQAIESIKQKNPVIQVLKNSQLQTQTTQLTTCETEISIIEENMKLLSQELQQVSLYFSGSEVTADV